MNISNIQIRMIPEKSGLIAFASMVIDEKLRINGIGIHQKSNGSDFRLTYPTRKTGLKDTYLFHPIAFTMRSPFDLFLDLPDHQEWQGQKDLNPRPTVLENVL